MEKLPRDFGELEVRPQESPYHLVSTHLLPLQILTPG